MQAQQQPSFPFAPAFPPSLLHAPMRTCVYRFDGVSWINVNDEAGLPEYGDYTITQHLEDLAMYEERALLSIIGCEYSFSDGSIVHLQQCEEAIPERGYLDMLMSVAVEA